MDPMHLPETVVVSKTKETTRNTPRIQTMAFNAKFATRKELKSGKPSESSPDIGEHGKPTHPETKRAFDAALKHARELVDAGAVGKGDVEVTIAGHVNENNEPQPGWPADSVTISIRRPARP
jgi:hypothetical protein